MDMTIHEEKLTEDRRKDIERVYKESGGWNKVITTVVCKDCPSSMHAFVDFVEEHFKTKIKDVKHLKKLTDITEETLDGLEETLIFGREDAYRIAIMKAIIKGKKYKGLLEIEPTEFGLPNRWIAFYPSEEVDRTPSRSHHRQFPFRLPRRRDMIACEAKPPGDAVALVPPFTQGRRAGVY